MIRSVKNHSPHAALVALIEKGPAEFLRGYQFMAMDSGK